MATKNRFAEMTNNTLYTIRVLPAFHNYSRIVYSELCKHDQCLAGRMAMHACQIGRTDTALPCLGSPTAGLCCDKRGTFRGMWKMLNQRLREYEESFKQIWGIKTKKVWVLYTEIYEKFRTQLHLISLHQPVFLKINFIHYS